LPQRFIHGSFRKDADTAWGLFDPSRGSQAAATANLKGSGHREKR